MLSVKATSSQVAGVDLKVLVTTVFEPIKTGIPILTRAIVGGVPLALTDTALPPAVASETTLIVPPKSPAAVGVKRTLTFWLFAAGILPLQAPENPEG